MFDLKLGRLPRAFNRDIPHFSTLKAGKHLPSPPPAVDYSEGLPEDLGMMLNDSLGDCTCAAIYHARQIWTHKAMGTMITEPDSRVLELYEAACGYDPKHPSTDQGGVEQDVLTYLLKTGMRTGAKGYDKILAFLEVNFRNLEDLKRTIYECGVAYIGIDVPQSVMDNANDPTIPWNTKGNNSIVGGHAVVLVGYDLDTFTCISWGTRYKITHAFLGKFLDEAYAIADPAWIMATGKTPLGLTVPELESIMQAIKK